MALTRLAVITSATHSNFLKLSLLNAIEGAGTWAGYEMACRLRPTQILRRARCLAPQSSQIFPVQSSTRARSQSTASIKDTEGIAKGTIGPTKTIKFTSDTYSEIKRDSKFSEITEG